MTGAEDLLWFVLPSLHCHFVVVHLTTEVCTESVVSDETSVREMYQDSGAVFVRVLE